MVTKLSAQQDRDAVNLIRGIAMDAPLAAKSGHQGTAMALAPLGHVLYSRIMRHDPKNPQWKNRDRFILSNGHASILQYALLFLNGYGVELNDLKQFRQFGSATPGHPEAGHTPGVEVTTGPLGQGFANAVGMAIAERNLRARFGASACDHNTFVLAGDGCLMEGISHEAASLAGHLKLDRLVCIFDDNAITIDGSTSLSCSDDVAKRFSSYGWNVMQLGDIAEDLDALEESLVSARSNRGAPTLCILKSHIGTPSPDFTDSHEAHGNPFTAAHVTATKKWVFPMNLFGLQMIWSVRVDRLPKRADMALQPNMQATSPSFQKNICGTLLGKLRIHHHSDHCFLILIALLILQLGK
ncbi:MAG: transketolase [Actinomycetota bacterium]